MVTKLLISFILLSLISFSSSLPDYSISKAIEVLLNSGFVSMALTLEFGSKNLIPQTPSLTIFTPSDSTFASSGQPSLSLMQFHFSPQSLSPQSFKSLPFNSKIPTLSPSHSLIVTSPPSGDNSISLNGVKVNASSVIYDDGSLRIFGIEKFFDQNYRASSGSDEGTNQSPNVECIASVHNDGSMSFDEAVVDMKEKGYSIMASFLELQIGTIKNPTLLTVFAPPDEAMVGYFGNFSEYSSVFLRHVVPCKLPWSELIRLDYPTVVPTFLERYNITISLSHMGLLLNKVLIVEDVYMDDWIAVLGIADVLPNMPVPEPSSQIRRSMVNLEVLKILIAFSFMFLCIFGF